MKVLQINIFGNLSTGRIAVDIYRTLISEGYQGVIAFARNSVPDDVPYIKIGNNLGVYCDGVLTRLTDRAGFFSQKATRKLIKEIQEYNPDIIHLHNLHGYYINVEVLFEFLGQYGKPVVWTLHDCWAFTGHCCYYSMMGCEKWIDGCHDCEQIHAYPKSLFIDNSKNNYIKKQKLFTSMPNLQLVTVSKWLEGEVKKSFLKNLQCTTIYNGIDLNVFKPTDSDFRKKYGIEDKVIILGVASTWDVRKGLNDFIKLSSMLSDEYRIVLVGVSKEEKTRLPQSILGIERTNSVEELSEIYTASDVFFNASVEETFGLPTVEAMACGTPVIVYDCTALPEVVNDQCGFVVKEHDLKSVIDCIKKASNIFEQSKIVDAATKYSKQQMANNYIKKYRNMMKQNEEIVKINEGGVTPANLGVCCNTDWSVAA